MIKLSGAVLQNIPTKGGNWHRLVVSGSGRINDLLMVPSTHELAAAVPGLQELADVPVRSQVETTADGRPMKSIVYWLADAPAVASSGKAA